MAAIAEELNVQLFCKDTEQQYLQVVYHYQKTAAKARLVYLEKLWNGKYLNYDSSDSSHHDSIMADMLAGQWYARACQLPPVIPSANALSCYRIIYSHNVRSFGLGKLIGAVNGTKYNELIDTKYKPYSGSKSNGDLVVKCQVDNSCMQSREVWTGTTYALAAGMMSEALHRSSDDDQLTQEERLELLQMASDTAQGIHDGGWQRFGYWFATPEGWEQNGNYRSLGYMRPLSIWAMQYAKEISKK